MRLTAEQFQQKYGSQVGTPQQPATPQPREQAVDTGLFSGTKTFGRGFVAMTQAGKGAQESLGNLEVGARKMIETALKKPIGDPGRTRLLKEAQSILGGASDQADDLLKNILPTEKQFGAGAVETALTASTPFLPSGAGIFKGAAMAAKGAKYAKVASVAGMSLAGAIEGYIYDKSQQGVQNKDITAAPGAGTAIGGAFPIVMGIGGSIIKQSLGITSRSTKAVIERNMANPDAISQAVRKYANNEGAKLQLIDKADDLLNGAVQQRNAAYQAFLDENMIAQRAISKDFVKSSFEQQLGKFGGRIKGGEIVFKNSALTGADQKVIQEAWADIAGWSDMTPTGLDTLRQKLGEYARAFKFANNPRASVVVGGVKKALTKEMGDAIPGYTEALTQYGQHTDAIKALTSELGLNASKPSSSISSILRIFKKDPTVLKTVKEAIGEEAANSFLDDISGAILSEWFPRGSIGNLASIGIPTAAGGFLSGAGPIGALAGLASASPRVVGGVTRGAARAIQNGVGTGIRRAATYLGSRTNQEQ